jgi:glutamyl-tRNA synthetase
MLGFLFADDANAPAFAIDPEEKAKVLGEGADEVLKAAVVALEGLTEWTTQTIEQALRVALIDGLELKPKVAFGSVRVAVTGRRVSPPLFESMELLGRERSLSRVRAAIN